MVKQTATVSERQMVAGRMQARESNVEEMTLAQRVTFIWREMEIARAAHDTKQAARKAEGYDWVEWMPDKTALLTSAFLKTGVKDAGDNSMV